MNFALTSIIASLLLFLSLACSVKTEEKNELTTETRIPLSATQTVQINKSIVEAEIIEKYTNTDSDFIIKAKVIKVEETDEYPSMAVVSSVYLLTPAFFVDDSGSLPNNDKNKRLKSLLTKAIIGCLLYQIFFKYWIIFFWFLTKKGGDKIKAVISMGKDLNWYIQTILD